MLHQPPRPPAEASPAPGLRSVFVAMLHEQLECRAREHGHAYVTPREAAWLETQNLTQPGHTIHRYSTFDEDRSDRALARRSSRMPARRRGPRVIPS